MRKNVIGGGDNRSRCKGKKTDRRSIQKIRRKRRKGKI
jgi:hypothetical protein